jgi:hypothetical protein
MPKLTDATIKNSKIGELSDAQVPGLSLITRASTSKTKPTAKRRFWSFRFTLDGKRLKMGLGPYPAVSLEEAHRKARKAATLVAKDFDPRIARREDPANLAFRNAVEAYLVEALPRYPSATSRHSLQHALRVHCGPLHDKPVLEIGTRDVANLLKALAPPTAKKFARRCAACSPRWRSTWRTAVSSCAILRRRPACARPITFRQAMALGYLLLLRAKLPRS